MKDSSDKIPDVVDDSGVTPAHFASQQGHLDCLQVVLELFCCLLTFLICSSCMTRAVA